MSVTWAQRDHDHLVDPDSWERAWDMVRDRYCLAREVEERAACQAIARLFGLLAFLRAS